MTKFVLLTDRLSAEQEDLVTAYLQGLGMGFWHYLENSWLVDSDDLLSTTELRDGLKQAGLDTNILVIAVKATDWAISAPKSSFEWLHENWSDFD